MSSATHWRHGTVTIQIVRERIPKRQYRDDCQWTPVSRRGWGSEPVRTPHTHIALLPRFADTGSASHSNMPLTPRTGRLKAHWQFETGSHGLEQGLIVPRRYGLVVPCSALGPLLEKVSLDKMQAALPPRLATSHPLPLLASCHLAHHPTALSTGRPDRIYRPDTRANAPAQYASATH